MGLNMPDLNNALAEMRLVAREAVDDYHEKLKKELPNLLKPTIYEVSERTITKFGKLMNVDINEVESVRALQDDLNHLRKSRLASDDSKSIVRQTLIKVATMTGIAALAAYFGWNISK